MVEFVHVFDDHISVKELIEGIGIPANEVDLVLVNGESVNLSSSVNDGDKVSIYPVFESFDISSLTRLRAHPLRQTRFVLDVHLGKLAAHLRMLGFDTLYRNDYTDEELVEISRNQDRILLSRDRALIEERDVTRGYCIQSDEPSLQLDEVVRRFDLFTSIHPFQRCLRCNTTLLPVEKNLILHRLPRKVNEFFDEFRYCPGCDRIYWKGSHYRRMTSFINTVLHGSPAS
jgi:uncharacterized protein